MPAPRNRKHLLIRIDPTRERYTPHPQARDEEAPSWRVDRVEHAGRLRVALVTALKDAVERRREAAVSIEGASPGVYVQYESQPGEPLNLERLEALGSDIVLAAVQREEAPGKAAIERATVFVPDEKIPKLLQKFDDYATKQTPSGAPKNGSMLEPVAALRAATLQALWTDADAWPGEDQAVAWEIWLRRSDGGELGRLAMFASTVGLVIGEHRLAFEDRLVVLVRGTARQLAMSLDLLNDVMELRRARQTARFYVDGPSTEQRAWIDDLLKRVEPPLPQAPVVCVLDSGITWAHPLLTIAIVSTDAHAVVASWGGHDNGGGPESRGHGTMMAGLALYGDLVGPLSSSAPVVLGHRLESVKILPPTGANAPELYGAITAAAVAVPEGAAPERARIFCLAVTATAERDRGQPTSWSATIDALAAGRAFDPITRELAFIGDADEKARRLFVISGGNVSPDRLAVAHLDRSDLEPVDDPAQAWNALTVGAFTEKALLHGSPGWSPVAPPGELSPWSTTSVTFADLWPIKPDVVMEGGNVAHDGTSMNFPIPELSLLSTHWETSRKLLSLAEGTSAATAQVARLAAQIRCAYPEYWPETVRALIVHSARWTKPMQTAVDAAPGKRATAALVRRYGFGVPSTERALRSAADSLTLVAQSKIHPFHKGAMGEMNVHELPWPKDVLAELGDKTVHLRVTLSYFIEPNPARRGWRSRYRYASHGLRFEMKQPTEDLAEFRKRLTPLALEENEKKPRVESDSDEWLLGPQARTKGSLHSDVWSGAAAELAERGVFAICPVSGWWKDIPKRDRSAYGARYALLASIETEAQDVDLWQAVATMSGVEEAEVWE